MATPTKIEIEQKVSELAKILGNSFSHPRQWMKPPKPLNKGNHKARELSNNLLREVKLIYRKRVKELQLYMLEKELINIGNKIERFGLKHQK